MPSGRGGMLEEQSSQTVGVERAGAAEYRLAARVVPRGTKPAFVAHDLPAQSERGRPA